MAESNRIAVAPALAPAASVPLTRRRRAVVWILVVAASLITLVSILTIWVNRQMLSSSAWKRTSTQMIQNPAIQSALAVYLIDQLYSSVDVSKALERRLPPALKGLAGPLAGALEQPATQTVQFLLGRPRVQQLFINASSLAHDKLVNVLENKTGHGISTGNGNVTIDLSQLITSIATELGLPQAVIARIPADAGTITVMKSSQLSAAQDAVRALKVLSVWLLVLVLALYALALYLARGIRRATLRNIGWAFILVGLLVVLIRRFAENYVIDSLTRPEYRVPGRQVFLIASSTLGDIGWATFFYGLIALLGALLAGPTRYATYVRRYIAPVLNEQQGYAWLAVGLVYLLLVFWGPTYALHTWWGVLLLGALIAVGLVALRRETLREFPSAHPTGPVAAT